MRFTKILIVLITSFVLAGVHAKNREANRLTHGMLNDKGNALFVLLQSVAENNETLRVQSSKAAEAFIFALLQQKTNVEKMLLNRSIELNTPIVIDSCELKNGIQAKILTEAACATNINYMRVSAQLTLTPLQATCLTGDLATMKMLIKAGAKVNNDAETLSPLDSCLSTKKYNQADFLINQGANININRKNKKIFISPLGTLMFASVIVADHAAEARLAELMLRKGADPHYRDKYGNSELHAAAGAGNLAIVKLLVELNVDINTKDDEGMSPLGRAEKYNHTAVVDYLISKGAQR